ncbi:hypothetical protein V6N13_053889 [Hibiscus sabdariffa]
MMAELLEKKKGKNLQLTKKAKEAISALITVDKRDGSGNGWKVASGPSANDTMCVYWRHRGEMAMSDNDGEWC